MLFRSAPETKQEHKLEDEKGIWAGLDPNLIQDELVKLQPGFSNIAELAALLEHENTRLVATVVETIERICSEEDILKLLTPCINHENNRVRANVFKAIGKIQESRIHQPLSEMLQSPKISMRESAVWAVNQLPE